MKLDHRYTINENGETINKKTLKDVNRIKVPYGCGATKCKLQALKDITEHYPMNYIFKEWAILKSRKILETRIIPFNI